MNVEDEVNMLSLEFVFLPRINMHIALFLAGYHNHPISTESNKTPLQLWIQGQHNYQPLQEERLGLAVDDFDNYGVDWDEPPPVESCDANSVCVPVLNTSLSENMIQRLQTEVNSLNDFNGPDMETYLLVRNVMKEMLS